MKQWLINSAALVTALSVLGGAGWGILAWADATPVLSRDIEPLATQVAANSQSLALQRWQYLEAKRQNQGLTPNERLEYCALSRQLGFQGVGCV